MVTQKEIIKALRLLANWHDTGQADEKRFALASRIEAEGIAPPDGMVLVPNEPTQAMIEAGEYSRWNYDNTGDIYKAMLAAAPLSAPPDGWVLVPWKTLDDACELLELHGEHEHPDYKALKATTSAAPKGVVNEQE